MRFVKRCFTVSLTYVTNTSLGKAISKFEREEPFPASLARSTVPNVMQDMLVTLWATYMNDEQKQNSSYIYKLLLEGMDGVN